MKPHFTRTGIVLAMFSLSIFSCKKNMTPEKIDETSSKSMDGVVLQPSPYAALADTLESRLANTVGYSFAIYDEGKLKVQRSKGFARLALDAPSRAMDVHVKYSTASVSKTITAAALLKALSTPPNVFTLIDQPIYPYLPSHWQLGPNIKTITFRELLNHTSGFSGPSGSTYQELKTLIGVGIVMSNKTYAYNNRNYALMRLLIPKLAGYYITQPSPILNIATVETFQETQYASAYMDYCHKVIFAKVPSMVNQQFYCKSTDPNPGLVYNNAMNPTPGVLLPDFTLVSGGQGWVLSTAQVADFFRTLHYTEDILPKLRTNQMITQKLGYDKYETTTDGVKYYWKNGIYPAGYRSLIIGFEDGIQITIMANSPIALGNAAIAAHQDWFGRMQF